MSKIGNRKIFGRPVFQGKPPFTQITTINMHLLNEIKHGVHIHAHGNYIEVKNINDMLEIDLLRNSS